MHERGFPFNHYLVLFGQGSPFLALNSVAGSKGRSNYLVNLVNVLRIAKV